MTKRYKELIKENNDKCLLLKDEYLDLANIYIKKARGYAVKSEDTEVKIRNTLNTIYNYQQSNQSFNEVITNKSTFIETEIRKLSKQVKDYDFIKGAIIFAVIVIVGILWGSLSCFMNQKGSFVSPSNIRVSNVVKVNENKANVTIAWDEIEFAESYSIYYSNGNLNSTIYTTTNNEYTLPLEYGKTYTFYLYTNETDYINKSDTTTFVYELIK